MYKPGTKWIYMNPDKPKHWKKEVVLKELALFLMRGKNLWQIKRREDGPAFVEERFLVSPDIIDTPLFNALMEEKEKKDDDTN